MCKFGCNNASQHAKVMHHDEVCKLNSVMSCISRMHNSYFIFNIQWACPYFHNGNKFDTEPMYCEAMVYYLYDNNISIYGRGD